ncbi:hypothetical protein NPIL_156551 [Nephila pilipes]|uniref:Uncharacterized protein n=1 Tax=Nephila pilipes TaxID=299642 RepID=A0A8X6T9F1_NEPPI|nr:hypothetical protein NPIL_156551 [Nephila pilipes]
MYLNTTKDFNLVIDSMSPPVLICYTYADCESDTSTRSSIVEMSFFLRTTPFPGFRKDRSVLLSLSAKQSTLQQPKQHKKFSG